MYAGDEIYGDAVTSGLHWHDRTERPDRTVTVTAEEVEVGQTVRNPFTGEVFTVVEIRGLTTIDPNCRALLLQGDTAAVTLFLGETLEVLG